MTDSRLDAAWPGVYQGFSSQYRLGHHSGWNAAVAALSRSTPTPDTTDAAYQRGHDDVMRDVGDALLAQSDATDAGSREAVMALVIDDLAPAAGLIERRGFELAIKAVLDILKSPSTPTTEGLDVERLARAMRECDGVTWPRRWFETEHNFDWVARQVAAEYARLGKRP